MRSLEHRPSIASTEDNVGLPYVRSAHGFPADYRIDLETWFDDSKLVVDLVSIAKRVPLLARTRYVRLAKWIEEIDPNCASGAGSSGGYVSDV